MQTIVVKAFTLFMFIGILSALLWLYFSEKHELSEVFFFEGVEQEAALIRYKEYTALIDTVEEGNCVALIDWLENLRVESLDALVLTHDDGSHIGGTEAVFQRFEVKQVFRSPYLTGSDLEH